MMFTCGKCGNEVKFNAEKPITINLICQKCGCYDLRLDKPAKITPFNVVGAEFGAERVVKAEEYIKSSHEFGSLWKVEEMKEEEKKDEPSTLSSIIKNRKG